MVGTLVALAALPSCAFTDSDRSVVVEPGARIDPRVQNGTAYDRGAVELVGAGRVVLPEEAIVRRGGEGRRVELLMAKSLHFAGHPGEPMSIRQVRAKMGCATRAEGGALVVAVHGEWDSGIEGGRSLKLVAMVPVGVEVEQRKGLSKPADAGRVWSGLSLPAAGWTAVPDTPDPERLASK
jgi:hypothetical protein